MNWHALSEKEVIEKLDSSRDGLNSDQVLKRLEEFGENKLKKITHFNALKVFLSQFKSFLIIILIVAALLSFFMHSPVDSIVILAIVVLNAGFGFFQEYKAEKAIEELRKIMVDKVRVLRSGKVVEINAVKIVPGDILVLQEGDKIMADARILEVNGLKVNEASLTGESFPGEKFTRKLGSSVSLVDRVNIVYQGTEIVSGSGNAIVINTGMKTELGKISELVQEVKPEKNPFKEKLDNFAKKIGIFIFFLSLLIIGLLILEGSGIFESVLVAVSLAVSAIPEGLPAVISLGLAFATRRLIKKNVLIRKLPSSETLGRTTVICTDKTGTLTEGKMVVSKIYTNGEINPHKENDLLFKIGVLCNKAVYEKEGDKKYFIGDPTEVALIVSAQNNFMDKKKLTEEHVKIKEFPFDSDRKMMSIVRKSGRKYISYVKGAPEKIIQRCDYELINGKKIRLEERDKQRIMEVYSKMAKEGLRILGFAYKEVMVSSLQSNEASKIVQEIAENKLVFVGFQGMIDPPRKEVKEAIKSCNRAGIKVIMVTGDSKLTADAVAAQIGLTGISIGVEELEKMSDRELYDEINDISIFARISPKDKLRIINILKKKNEIVAMTGDGVNDALALKRADIGIAMGIRGTDVAKSSSDIVLVDDNFASIVEGIKEGRRIYDNVKKFVKYLLAANFYEVFLVLLVMVIWQNPEFLPLLPLHILWINLITDGFPALALSSEPMESGIMSRKPNKKGILEGIKGFVFFSGLIGLVILMIVFFINVDDIDKARTIVVTTSVIYQMFLVFNCRSDKSIFKSPINKYVIYAVIFSIFLHLIVLYTPLNSLFYFVELGLKDWIQIIGISFAGFLLVEGFKVFER